MRNYIILTADICQVGGMQAYVSSKVRYLKENRWRVNVFFPSLYRNNTPYKHLEEYIDDYFWVLSYPPNYFSKHVVEKVLRKMIAKIKVCEGREDVIIETQNDTYALWGELLASKLEGKNFCFNCNEIFRGPEKFYEENLDYFYYKLGRHELVGIHNNSVKMMFDGHYDIGDKEFPKFTAAIDDPVEEVNYDNLTQICSDGWKVCYIGRLTKRYVPEIVKGIINFAQLYKKKMQLIFVGIGCEEQLTELLQNRSDNLTYCFLGEFVPLPRKLFEQVDVVIAGSGCALISARQGVPTIVADAKRKKAIGVLGYNTEDFLYSDKELYPYEEMLEEVLVKGIGKCLTFTSDSFCNSDETFSKHLELIAQSSQEKKYYNVEQRKKCRGLRMSARIKISLCNIFGYDVSVKVIRTIQHAKSIKNIRSEKNG